jgi:hypothetical protein
MPDQDDRTPRTPEPDRPTVVNVPDELQPRCRAKVDDARCSRPEGREGDHRTEPPECAPDEPAGMPDVVRGDYEAASVALRATYRVALRERDARRLEQLADQLAEDEDEAVAVPTCGSSVRRP